MQSIAADCAPVARIAHHFRVYASAAERRSNEWSGATLSRTEVVGPVFQTYRVYFFISLKMNSNYGCNVIGFLAPVMIDAPHECTSA